MFNLSKNLIERLDKEKILYCHWKSNVNLEKALGGYDDLDLLVDEKDIVRFEKIILDFGFKEAFSNYIKFPYVKHFYGLDNDTDKILHLHVYYKIVTGESLIKSFILPNELILKNLLRHSSGMPIPDNNVEFIVFIIRTLIKSSSLIEIALIYNKYKEILKELDFLSKEIKRERISEILNEYFNGITIKFTDEVVEVLKKKNFLKLWILGQNLKKKLGCYRRISLIERFFYSWFQVFFKIANKFKLKQKKKFKNGGKIIAITGLDATGKSTISLGIYKWLRERFDVHLIHLGKPPSSFLTLPFNLLINIAKKPKGKFSFKTSGKETKDSFFYTIIYFLLAYDRMVLIKKFLKKSQMGDIIVCDRYPSQSKYVMDSQRLNSETSKGLLRLLSIWEEKYYKSIPQPNILFNLRVPLEVAIMRNKERVKQDKESEEKLRKRYLENIDLKYSAENIISIDVDKPYEETIKIIKKRLWELL